MRLSLPKSLLLPLLAVFSLSCDQDLNSAGDQPLVDYVLVVIDSANNAALDSVRVRVTTITGDTSTFFTDLADGRVELPTLSSSQTRFKLSRKDFRSLDFVDTVSGTVDTVFRRPIARILKIKMLRAGADSARRTQFTITFRDAGLERLRKGRVAYTDSLGSDRVVVDGDSDGVVELSGMRRGDNQTVRAEHAGYLGQKVRVNVGALTDSIRFAPGTTVTLVPLSSGISGQVNYMTASGPKGLANAKVVFVPKDSLAIPPGEFAAISSSRAGSEGWYEIKNVPAVEGDVYYRKNAVTGEFLKKAPLTAEDVLRDGPLAAVTLIIPLDSLAPMVDTLPKDTLNPKDALIFHFNQPVERFTSPVVRLINSTQRIITSDSLDGSKKSLRVVQNGDDWVAGKTYSYEFTALNAQGQGFTRAGDTLTVVRGTFTVREKAAVDTGFIYPTDIRIAGFNSGASLRFDTSSAESSPKGDSTTRFVRIAWKWGTGKHVDSLLVCIKDAQTNTSWTQVQSIPGFEDSTTVDLAVIYSTALKPSGKPLFPLLLSANQEVQVKVMYIEDGRLLAKETPLPSIRQEMGPPVYTRFDTSGTVRREPDEKDTLLVSFPATLLKPETAVDFGSGPLKPNLFVGDNKDVNLDWEWIDGKSGRLIYKVSESMGVRPLLRVDVNGMLIDGKPVWQRDRKNGFRLF
jgi:hypothetical protein